MPIYSIQIRTKLGSVRSKTISANSEDEAIQAGKDAFPLHEKVWSDGEVSETKDDETRRAESQARIEEMKLNADLAKAKSKRSEGLIWLGVGITLTLAALVFMRDATLIALGPVIWGGYMFKKADSRYKALSAN
ncbi:hypothetical protein [Pelagicoccus albus]|uniref:Uncharacterized protein n=1 Tax=Pelagicoccus albus TaxID=415222 RepID=A0A7X1B315_9BACT|nr:hypothetical protein [Pelagicoccus albus]MBC2604735.1 hypothetical protein [Pelagicoccus albus]